MKGVDSFYEFSETVESQGIFRTIVLAKYVQETTANDAFLVIDEIESSLYPRLVEYIVERFLKESKNAQLLFTTRYDGLLAEEDLILKNNVWFIEKSSGGSTALYPLADFKRLSRISSLQKAYKFGKFGAYLIFKVVMKRQKVTEYLSGNLCSR